MGEKHLQGLKNTRFVGYKQALRHTTCYNTEEEEEEEEGKQETTVFSPDLTYKIGMKVNNKTAWHRFSKVEGSGGLSWWVGS